MSYTLDATAAKKANASGRITETGAYIGVFTRAESVTSKQGTQGIEFTFVDDLENTADFLSLWTVKQNGETIYGYNVLMSLMACMKTRTINETEGIVPKYDSVAKQVVNTKALLFKELMNKRIGVLLQAEEYKSNNGDIKTRMTIAGFFDPQTRLVAKEILEQKSQPELLQKMIDKMPSVKKLSGNQAISHSSGTPDIADDDIPF